MLDLRVLHTIDLPVGVFFGDDEEEQEMGSLCAGEVDVLVDVVELDSTAQGGEFNGAAAVLGEQPAVPFNAAVVLHQAFAL